MSSSGILDGAAVMIAGRPVDSIMTVPMIEVSRELLMACARAIGNESATALDEV